MKRCAALLILMLGASLANADLYKWVDADGKVHYTDTPPPAGAKKSERKQLRDKPAEAALPYSLQQAMKNFPVTLFSLDCGDGCKQASALLAKRGVPYTAKDPTDPAVREELKKATGGEAVAPVLLVGRQVLRGFEEGQWNAALDNAGYPKTALVPTPAPAKPKPAAPAPQEAQPAGDAGQPASGQN